MRVSAFDVGETNLSELRCYKDNLENLVDGDALQICDVLCAAWGLLLQCFTGLDKVSFGFEHQRITDADADSAALGPCIAHMNLPNDKVVKALLEEIDSGRVWMPLSPAYIDISTRSSHFAAYPGQITLRNMLGRHKRKSNWILIHHAKFIWLSTRSRIRRPSHG